jgi:hypothetical protein
VLESIAGDTKLFPDYEKYIEQTIRHINTHVKVEAARHMRSAVYSTLDTQQWPDEHKIVWHTVIHAWNYAVQNTLDAQGGSLAELPLSAPVGIYLDKPTDALIPIIIKDGRVIHAPFSGKAFVPFLCWDPAALGWSEIRNVLNKTSKTRDGFQAALKNADSREVCEAVEQHVNALAPCFDKNIMPDIPGLLWWIAAGAAVWIGNPTLAEFIPIVGKFYNDVSDALRRGYRRYRVANTLRESAYKMKHDQKT